MKIWLDLRFINDNLYSSFVIELTKELIKKKANDSFVVYTNKNLEWFDFQNTKIKVVDIANKSFREQTKLLPIFKNDKNDLMLFFNHFKPLFYVWNYITIIPSLKEIYYSNFINYVDKYSYLYLLEKNLKRSNKIICFDKNTKEELIEKYNIAEKNIGSIKWFFPNKEKLQTLENLKIDIKTKYNIRNDFILYSWWEWVEKNYDKLVHAYKKLKDEKNDIDLVFLWESISRNIALRNLIIHLGLQNSIHFIWVIKPAEKILFYKNSIWTIFPSLYEPFPFKLTEPICFNSPILASDLENIKNIFSGLIDYMSPISSNNIYENLKTFIKKNNKKTEVNYKDIFNEYSKENSLKQLLEII